MARRKIPIGRRSLTGWKPALDGQFVDYESRLERDFIVLTELDHPHVLRIESQPVTIQYRHPSGRMYPYTPDFLVTRRVGAIDDGRVESTIYEVKEASELQAERKLYAAKFAAMRKRARPRGWKFKVVTERQIRTPRLENAKFLARFKRRVGPERLYDRIVETLREQGRATCDQLLDAVATGAEERRAYTRALWHLIWSREILCSLNKRVTLATIVKCAVL